MAVSSYQNPIEYQMYSAFENKEEDTAPVTTTNLTETQPVATTTTAPTTTQLPRSSLDILQSAGVQPTRAATDILKSAGVTSAKDVLRSMYLERPEGVLESQGISAASILEDYRKEQAAFKQRQNIANIAQQSEADFIKKEQDFIKNYKYAPSYTPTYTTKYGKLNFSINDEEKPKGAPGFDSRYTFTDGKNVATYAYLVLGKDEKNQENEYVFLPEDVVLRGLDIKNVEGYKSVVNKGFLNQETLSTLYKTSQPIDLSEVKINVAGYNVDSGATTYGRGFLFDKASFDQFYNKNLKNNFVESYTYDLPYANTPILGIGNYNGELVYVRDKFVDGRTTYYNTHINKEGLVNGTQFTAPKDHSGVRGVFQDVGEFVASVPFLPEIAALIAPPGTQGYVYASMKALQVSGSGGEPEDVLKAAAVAYVTAEVGQELNTYGDSLGASIEAATGVSATVATTMGHAVVNAGFNGVIAAATGQDVGDAMLTGAISGGLGANAADITNTVFGGAENVASLSKALNLDVKQTQRIFTGALASGAINSVVKDQSFMDAFTESLIVQGVSQSGANAVGNSLKGTLSPKALQAIQSNTRIFLQATARAAVRGEDIETAIARVAPYLQGRAIGQTVNILTSKKD